MNYKTSAWLPIMLIISMAFWIALAILANGWRVDNIKKNKEMEELKKYKCSWEDFNKSFIPGTALPRLPEIEAIYNEAKNDK